MTRMRLIGRAPKGEFCHLGKKKKKTLKFNLKALDNNNNMLGTNVTT